MNRQKYEDSIFWRIKERDDVLSYFRENASSFIECSTCQSNVSKKYLSQWYLWRIAKCPVCHHSLLSDEDYRKIENLIDLGDKDFQKHQKHIRETDGKEYGHYDSKPFPTSDSFTWQELLNPRKPKNFWYRLKKFFSNET